MQLPAREPLINNLEMLSRNTSITIVTKFLILAANFALVVASTRLWGSEGRGEIALLLANISIIAIFGNVFCGSTIAFHTPVMNRDILLTAGSAGALLVSLTGSLFFSLLFGFRNFTFLLPMSFFLSLSTLVTSYRLGKKDFVRYNLLTLLNPLSILIFLYILYALLHKTGLETYYHAWYIGTGSVSLFALTSLLRRNPYKRPGLKTADLKRILNYGFKNEFNYLLQFLSYRLSYYFIARILGYVQLGIFSVVISVSEAVWIISRSMSAVHYSNVINSNDFIRSRKETVAFARQSFIISIAVLAVSVLVPVKVYQLVFGAEFGIVRKYILYMIPGIMAISVSNLYGHYFAGTGKLNIIRNKSLIGLLAIIISMPFLIKAFQMEGVCIAVNISYILSSVYLWVYFRREGKSLNFKTQA
jgi:O-antigen/teichoic acid export membrane protein